MEQDVAHDLQAAVWREVHQAFAARRADGMTQAELARRIGLERERVHYWLSRPERMTLKAAARLLAGMGARLECRASLEN
nr:helix-turn-helix transcriptional regulator [uncultured Brevundimonas sp.]